MFFGIVDDVVDKSDDNEESDSENETDNEDAEKDLCAEVRHSTVYSDVNQFNLHPLCTSFATNILRFFCHLFKLGCNTRGIIGMCLIESVVCY